jgi:hypothetical protein
MELNNFAAPSVPLQPLAHSSSSVSLMSRQEVSRDSRALRMTRLLEVLNDAYFPHSEESSRETQGASYDRAFITPSVNKHGRVYYQMLVYQWIL